MIQEGEHLHQDFKYCVNDSKKIAKSLVAFANTEGGRLLLGVKDNGRIAGVRTEEEFYMIESAATIFSKPAIKFSTRQWLAEGKTVLEIQVEPSNQKPHYAKDENDKWIAYLRVHDENCVAHKIQVNVWKNSKKPLHFTLTEIEKTLISYLSENNSVTLSKFIRLAHISRLNGEEILTNLATLDIVTINTTNEGTSFSLNQTYFEKTTRVKSSDLLTKL
jgi:hypothetical protein